MDSDEHILSFTRVVTRSARRIAYRMQCPQEQQDIAQEMWVHVCQGHWFMDPADPTINRILGTVGAKYVVNEKQLGMGSTPQDEPAVDLSPVLKQYYGGDRPSSLLDWALVQLPSEYREVLRRKYVFGDSHLEEPQRRCLRRAVRQLSEVVGYYTDIEE